MSKYRIHDSYISWTSLNLHWGFTCRNFTLYFCSCVFYFTFSCFLVHKVSRSTNSENKLRNVPATSYHQPEIEIIMIIIISVRYRRKLWASEQNDPSCIQGGGTLRQNQHKLRGTTYPIRPVNASGSLWKSCRWKTSELLCSTWWKRVKSKWMGVWRGKDHLQVSGET